MFRDKGSGSIEGAGASTAVARVDDAVVEIDPALLKAAEAKGKFVAIYIVWVLGESGFMIGKTRSPSEIPTQAERFNRRPIDFCLFWCPNDEIATRILQSIKTRLKQFFSHGSWYDGIQAVHGIKEVEGAAADYRVRLLTTVERDSFFRDAVTLAMEEQKLLEAAGDPRATRKLPAPKGANVVDFPAKK
jgi:hypothetical protein